MLGVRRERLLVGVSGAREVAGGGRSMIEEQVTNGVAVRMALLYLLALGRDAAAASAGEGAS